MSCLKLNARYEHGLFFFFNCGFDRLVNFILLLTLNLAQRYLGPKAKWEMNLLNKLMSLKEKVVNPFVMANAESDPGLPYFYFSLFMTR